MEINPNYQSTPLVQPIISVQFNINLRRTFVELKQLKKLNLENYGTIKTVLKMVKQCHAIKYLDLIFRTLINSKCGVGSGINK